MELITQLRQSIDDRGRNSTIGHCYPLRNTFGIASKLDPISLHVGAFLRFCQKAYQKILEDFDVVSTRPKQQEPTAQLGSFDSTHNKCPEDPSVVPAPVAPKQHQLLLLTEP